MSKEQSGNSVSIYISDLKSYSEVQDEIKEEWFKQYGRTLSKSEIVMKSLIYLRDALKGKSPFEEESKRTITSTRQSFCRLHK
jgi:hypothetical protein